MVNIWAYLFPSILLQKWECTSEFSYVPKQYWCGHLAVSQQLLIQIAPGFSENLMVWEQGCGSFWSFLGSLWVIFSLWCSRDAESLVFGLSGGCILPTQCGSYWLSLPILSSWATQNTAWQFCWLLLTNISLVTGWISFWQDLACREELYWPVALEKWELRKQTNFLCPCKDGTHLDLNKI